MRDLDEKIIHRMLRWEGDGEHVNGTERKGEP